MHARLTLILCATTFALVCAAPSSAKPPSAEDVERIKQAAPEKAPAKPAAARNILVFSRTKGFRHSSIETGTAAMKILGEKSGAFTTEHSEDPAVFTPENLKKFDAIILLNVTGDFLDTEEQKQALITFVREGKGVVGIHSATDAFYNFADYGEMMGGYFSGHPWHEKVTLKIDDPKNPCNACFTDANFEVTDEIYQFRPELYSRKKLRILTSLDNSLTNMKKGRLARGAEGDYGVSWLQAYGKGRVFYCSLGHREEIYWNPVILQHYLAGIQYATGDLKADDSPSEK